MKRILLTIAIALILNAAYAQKGFRIGVDGHFYSSWIVNQQTYGATEMEYDETWGWSPGIVIGYNFLDFFGIDVEFRYADLGQEYADLINNVPTDRTVDLHYYQIPLILKYTGGSGNPKFFFGVGPQLSFLTKASIDLSPVIPETSEFEVVPNAKDRFEDMDYGMVFNTGAQIGLTENLYLDAGLRFYYGFSDLNSPDWTIPNNKGVYEISRNAYGGITLGIHYLIGSKKYQLEEVEDPIIR